MARTIAHEGVHVGDNMQFLNSFDAMTKGYQGALNFTHFGTEFRAYSVGESVTHYDFLPRGDGFDQSLSEWIRQKYRNADELVFDPSKFCQQ